ncbi:MAG: hypothetical protein ABWZ16_13205 [Microbacterium sp.]
MESNSPRRTPLFGALAIAAILSALVALAAAWQSVARQEAQREAELDDWAHDDVPDATP